MSNEITVDCAHPECHCQVTAKDDSGVAYCSTECEKAETQDEESTENCSCGHSPCDSR